MDSTNFQQHHHHQQQQHQHHHLQEHFVGCSPLNHPSEYGVSTSLDWNNPNILSTSETSSNTYSNKLYENEFHGGATGGVTGDSRSGNTLTISPVTDVAGNLPKIEEDMLSTFPTSFSGLINSTITTSMNINPVCNWFNGFSSGAPYARGLFPLPNLDHKDHDHHSSLNSHINNWTNHGHGFPSTSLMGLVSSPNSTTSVTSSPCLGLNLQAMDFLGNNSSFSSHNRSFYDVLGEEVVSPAAKIMSNKKALMNGVTGTKRAAGSYTSDQPKASTSNNSTAAAKKSQLKVSCPPFKVRKEKLGDRIASLHQLVSPFGKTDTASVLTEAIGYIQFLQDQIHTLCMPHAKPSRNKPCRPFQMGSGTEEDRKEEERIDIRRRELCLVPLSWASYITPTQMDASNHSYF